MPRYLVNTTVTRGERWFEVTADSESDARHKYYTEGRIVDEYIEDEEVVSVEQM